MMCTYEDSVDNLGLFYIGCYCFLWLYIENCLVLFLGFSFIQTP